MFTELKNLTENVRLFLLEHADLPVKRGEFGIDNLTDKRSMSIQRTGGYVLKTHLNGRREMRVPITIYYRDITKTDNASRSDMLGVLDGIGEWLDSINTIEIYLGDRLRVIRFEQVQAANIAHRDDRTITYQAGYVLDYYAF